MDTLSSPVRMRSLLQRLLPTIQFILSLLCALFAGLLLFNTAVNTQLTSTIVNVGLDPQRSGLISALILTALAALIGAAIGRRRLAALLGASITFITDYLLEFIQTETQPTYDPGGHLEPLVAGALVHTSFVILALAILGALLGAAVGRTLGEVLLDPPYQLARLVWQHFAHASGRDKSSSYTSSRAAGQPKTLLQMVSSWVGGVLTIVLLVLAGGSGDLFIFSPDIGLHTMPVITSKVGLPSHGTIMQDSFMSSALGGQKREFSVYLPPSYNTSQGQNKRYPTLYLLHGSPGGDRDWFTAGKADQSADTLIALGKIPELILILPDGNGRPGATSEWGNSFDQHQRIETYVAIDLVKYVDSKYRTLPDRTHRGIGGLSMGGFGATNIALHHPDVFGFVISLGGYYRAEGSIWGNNPNYIRQNSPADVLPTDKPAWSIQYYLGAGTKDQPYYTDTLQFGQELAALHIPYQFDLQNGYHSWSLWETQMYNALLWLQWEK